MNPLPGNKHTMSSEAHADMNSRPRTTRTLQLALVVACSDALRGWTKPPEKEHQGLSVQAPCQDWVVRLCASACVWDYPLIRLVASCQSPAPGQRNGRCTRVGSVPNVLPPSSPPTQGGHATWTDSKNMNGMDPVVTPSATRMLRHSSRCSAIVRSGRRVRKQMSAS